MARVARLRLERWTTVSPGCGRIGADVGRSLPGAVVAVIASDGRGVLAAVHPDEVIEHGWGAVRVARDGQCSRSSKSRHRDPMSDTSEKTLDRPGDTSSPP